MRLSAIVTAIFVMLAAGATPAWAKKKKHAKSNAAPTPAKVEAPGPRAGTTGILHGEAAYRSSARAVNFKSTHINADRKTPMGTILTAASTPKDHDFVRLRFRWHPEMLASTDNLDNDAERPVAAKLEDTGGEAPLGGSVETAERKALSEAHAATAEADAASAPIDAPFSDPPR